MDIKGGSMAGSTLEARRLRETAMKATATFFLASALAATGAVFAAEKDRSGEEIVKQQCSQCHATGAHGAPRIDDRAAWVPRMKNGLDATVRSAIRGHGSMPARGGMASLTDSELRSAVVYMFNTAGPATPPPARAEPGPNQKLADGMEIYLGVKPVKDGVAHVNITVRDEKTHEAVDDAQVEVAITNPVMGTERGKLKSDGANSGSYGGDFRMAGKEPHVITVQIRRPKQSRVTQTKFDYKG